MATQAVALNRSLIALWIGSVFLFHSPAAIAYDETWGIFQVRFSGLPNGGQVLAEAIRRDRGNIEDFYGRQFVQLLRLSYRFRIDEDVGLMLGLAHVDFEQGADENRLHQFLVTHSRLDSLVDVLTRVGFEQRIFEGGGDPITHRFRARLQLNPLPEMKLGAALYNESLYVPDGGKRFRAGWNENRFGVGLRLITQRVELYLYHTTAVWLRPRRDWDRLEWLQLQAAFNF